MVKKIVISRKHVAVHRFAMFRYIKYCLLGQERLFLLISDYFCYITPSEM